MLQDRVNNQLTVLLGVAEIRGAATCRRRAKRTRDRHDGGPRPWPTSSKPCRSSRCGSGSRRYAESACAAHSRCCYGSWHFAWNLARSPAAGLVAVVPRTGSFRSRKPLTGNSFQSYPGRSRSRPAWRGEPLSGLDIAAAAPPMSAFPARCLSAAFRKRSTFTFASPMRARGRRSSAPTPRQALQFVTEFALPDARCSGRSTSTSR